MRILLLARHYPPAVSGGAKRPFLLAHGLRGAGADVRVLAPSLPQDEPGWVVPHHNRDPQTTYSRPQPSLRGFAREMLLWPDPDIRWCMRAAQIAIASGESFDWVLSTSPPESIHAAGEFAARSLGARWAADFRDLWLMNPHRQERRRWHRRIGEGLQARRLLPRADLVTAVDPVVAEEARSFGARAVQILPHFTFSTPPTPAELPPKRLNIVHAGSIALSDPQADIAQLIVQFETARRTTPALMLHLVGRLTAREAEAVARSPDADHIVTYGPKPFEEAMSFIAGADGLILVASAKMHVPPSKIVDYLLFDLPIIAVGTGPWRDDPRCPKEDAIVAMQQLRKRTGPPSLRKAFDGAEAARLLLSWMNDAARF